MPASASASLSNRPAGPTKGCPERSSSLPGCSPTKNTSARRAPSPKTVCVPRFQRSQALQSAAASRKAFKLSRGGKNSAAECFDGALLTAVNPQGNYENSNREKKDRVGAGRSFWRGLPTAREAAG